MKSCNLNARETLSLVPVLRRRFNITEMPDGTIAKGFILRRYSSFALRELADLKIRVSGLTLANVMNYASTLPVIPGTGAENALDLDNSMLLVIDAMGEKFKDKDPNPTRVECQAYVIDGHTAPTSGDDWMAVAKTFYAKDFTDNMVVIVHGASTSAVVGANRQAGFAAAEDTIPLFLEVASTKGHSMVALHVAENKEALATLVNEKNAPPTDEVPMDNGEMTVEPDAPAPESENGATE